MKGVLTEEQEADGFVAFEDVEFVYIRRFGELCLTFGRYTTRESIREAVERIRRSPPGGGQPPK
ncbi:MAG: hypothetical protein KJ624_00895 [Chloroflexi bacterium]|nr:hypothetical protein [Chloroflexota bacterium]